MTGLRTPIFSQALLRIYWGWDHKTFRVCWKLLEPARLPFWADLMRRELSNRREYDLVIFNTQKNPHISPPIYKMIDPNLLKFGRLMHLNDIFESDSQTVHYTDRKWLFYAQNHRFFTLFWHLFPHIMKMNSENPLTLNRAVHLNYIFEFYSQTVHYTDRKWLFWAENYCFLTLFGTFFPIS